MEISAGDVINLNELFVSGDKNGTTRETSSFHRESSSSSSEKAQDKLTESISSASKSHEDNKSSSPSKSNTTLDNREASELHHKYLVRLHFG